MQGIDFLELSKEEILMEIIRPDWDTYFMGICYLVSSRSTCLRRKVGAVLVKEKRILATGYNGAPRNLPHCSSDPSSPYYCLRMKYKVPSGTKHELCRGLHAEQNALIQAANYGVSTEGSTLYCNVTPCIICAKMLINAGIKEIIFVGNYPDGLSLEMLQETDIKLKKIDFSPAEFFSNMQNLF
jgi:dCMP deaminase